MTQQLASLDAKVFEARERLQATLDDLPSSLRPVVESAYARRQQPAPAMGEYAIWLLPDLLPQATMEAADKVAPSLLGLRVHNVILDDIFDETAGSYAVSALASHLLFQRSLTEMLGSLPQNGHVQVRINQYFVEQAEAAHRELSRRGSLIPYTPEDIRDMGSKCSLSKVYAAAILFASGCETLEDSVLIPVHELATFIQFLDDLTDWEEDWHARNYTCLLTQTCLSLEKLLSPRSFSHEEFTARDIFLAMVLTGSMEETLEQAGGFLGRVLASPQLRPESVTDVMLRHLLREKASLSEDVAGARELLLAMKRRFGDSPDWLVEVGQVPEVRGRLREIERRMEILAQTC